MCDVQTEGTLELSREEMRTLLRLCTINPRTTEEDISETIRKLESFGRQLSV